MAKAARRIAVVTTSRADYSHLHWVLRELDARPGIDLRLIVTGAHLSPEFGRSVDVIRDEGFAVHEEVECLLSSDTDLAAAKTIGIATLGLAEAFDRQAPDLLLLIADRYEMLAPASAALAMRIPIAHIEGGDVSEGAIDHAVRNALTMMSHIHFTPTKLAARRVIAMGEEPWRVHHAGAPSLDHLKRSQLLDEAELEQRLAIPIDRPTCVVAYHPVTLERDTTVEADAVFEALDQVATDDRRIIFCFPNADAGSRSLIRRAEAFTDARATAHLFTNLNPITYWSLLTHADVMLGNSSSGIMESPSLELPCVNIGARQDGRERAANIIDASPEVNAIVEATEHALNPDFRASLAGMTNPYGTGDASTTIADTLESIEITPSLLRKRTLIPTS